MVDSSLSRTTGSEFEAGGTLWQGWCGTHGPWYPWHTGLGFLRPTWVFLASGFSLSELADIFISNAVVFPCHIHFNTCNDLSDRYNAYQSWLRPVGHLPSPNFCGSAQFHGDVQRAHQVFLPEPQAHSSLSASQTNSAFMGRNEQRRAQIP